VLDWQTNLIFSGFPQAGSSPLLLFLNGAAAINSGSGLIAAFGVGVFGLGGVAGVIVYLRRRRGNRSRCHEAQQAKNSTTSANLSSSETSPASNAPNQTEASKPRSRM
jgi:hypothetical protein